jgi:hypothetical protein
MKSTEVLEKLRGLTDVAVRQVEHRPATKLIFNPDQVILRPNSGGSLVPVAPEGVKSLVNFVGMPTGMAKQLSTDLLGRVTTELLARKGKYAVLMKDQQIIDFGEGGQTRNIPAERVVEVIEREIPDADFTRVTTGSDYSTELEVAGEKRQPVVRGDLVRAGALVKFSPVGNVVPSVQSFVQRLACTNGMVSNQVLREFHGGGGEGDNIWQWFRRSVHEAYGALGEIVQRYQEMVKDRITPNQRALMLEDLLSKMKIGGKVAEAIRDRAIQEAPRNSYDMLNLITWASSHIIKEPAQLARARTVTATFTDAKEHHTFCPVCHSRS